MHCTVCKLRAKMDGGHMTLPRFKSKRTPPTPSAPPSKINRARSVSASPSRPPRHIHKRPSAGAYRTVPRQSCAPEPPPQGPPPAPLPLPLLHGHPLPAVPLAAYLHNHYQNYPRRRPAGRPTRGRPARADGPRTGTTGSFAGRRRRRRWRKHDQRAHPKQPPHCRHRQHRRSRRSYGRVPRKRRSRQRPRGFRETCRRGDTQQWWWWWWRWSPPDLVPLTRCPKPWVPRPRYGRTCARKSRQLDGRDSGGGRRKSAKGGRGGLPRGVLDGALTAGIFFCKDTDSNSRAMRENHSTVVTE